MVARMWNFELTQDKNNNDTIQINIEFLDHVFTIEVPKTIDLDELFEIIEKYLLENPNISIDLKALSKTILDTEYYNLIMKQENILIKHINEIKIGIPLRLELESDSVKKRYFTKRHMKSTLRHIDSISINEFSNMFNIKNQPSLRQILTNLSTKYPFSVNEDIIKVDRSFTKEQLKFFTNELLDNVDY